MRSAGWWRVGLLAAVLAGTAAGCGEPAAGGDGAGEGTEARRAPEVRAPDSTLERLARELMPAVERSAGWEFRRPPRLARASRATLEEFLAAQLEEDLPPERARGIRRAYARFGLVADSLDLRGLLRTLYLEQVVGYYDPAADTLFVRDDVPEGQLRTVLVHEMVHALQDQHVDLDSLTEARAALNDAGTAARAAIEGHATFVMMEWMLGKRAGSAVDLTTLPGLRRLLGGVDLASLASMPALGDAPRVIRESLIFPYIGGLGFVQELWRAREGRPVPLGADTPASTEQILHPDRFTRPDRDVPTEVRLPGALPGGWTEVHADGLGELETRLFLETFLADTARARAAAAGWDGDRYRLAASPSGAETLTWVTVWDGLPEAEEFAGAVREAFRRRYGGETISPGDGGAGELRVGGRVVGVERRTVAGRPVVVVTDRPEGRAGADLGFPDEIRLEGGG